MRMTFALGSVLLLFVIGWTMNGQDRFGYVAGVVVTTVLYVVYEWLEEPHAKV